MKRSRTILLVVICVVVGFALGLAIDNFIPKAHANAKEETPELVSPTDDVLEVQATGSTSSVDYEIVTIYSRKYIIFKSSGDIEVLPY